MAHKVHYSRREYAEYLASAEWANLRELAMRFSDGICAFCRDAKATQVHHMTYRAITNVRITDLRPTCDPCHARIHALVKRRKLRLDEWDHGDVLFARTMNALSAPLPSKEKAPIEDWFAAEIVASKGVRRVAGILKVTIYGPESIAGMQITSATRARIKRLMPHPAVSKFAGMDSRRGPGKVIARY